MLMTMILILLIANIAVTIFLPDPRLDRLNYTASGMLIAAIIMLLMRG